MNIFIRGFAMENSMCHVFEKDDFGLHTTGSRSRTYRKSGVCGNIYLIDIEANY